MAMKELLSVTLNAKQIREACEAYVGRRIDTATEIAFAEVEPSLTIVVTVSKRRIRKPRGNGAVPSAGPLSEAEERYA